ncbi:MAG: DNA-3-methyladenine glycosylase [Candidatus Dormibacteraceae bacterium]
MSPDLLYSPSAPPGVALGPDFFARDTLLVAHDLIGKILVRGGPHGFRWGRLIEVEAYQGPEDLAAHSSRGLTPRTRTMYGPPGHAYVYLVYGIHHCLNFVTRAAGTPHAVLIRALEPGPGVDRCSGPGLVCRALDIGLELNGAELRPPRLWVVDDGQRPARVRQSVRIGVDYAREWAGRPWRYFVPPAREARPRASRPHSPQPPSEPPESRTSGTGVRRRR